LDSILDLLYQSQWKQFILDEVAAEKIASLTQFLIASEHAGAEIYPDKSNWFRALNELPPDDVKVVILGQDPYHGPKQAQGLSFSVPADLKLPPSLKNIFKEQITDLDIENKSGDLSLWVKQGVLLLNAVLTVEATKAGSHAKQGWEDISDALIRAISDKNEHVVFMLWGAFAEKKRALIDETRHLILSAAHPSPLSAHRGWFGSRHFSKANAYLKSNSRVEIDWKTDLVEQFSLLN